MVGEPDSFSRLLGRLEAYAETDIQAHKELRAVVENIGADVQKLVVATKDLPELKALVAQHEKDKQRRVGVVAAISGGVSLALSLAVAWIERR